MFKSVHHGDNAFNFNDWLFSDMLRNIFFKLDNFGVSKYFNYF